MPVGRGRAEKLAVANDDASVFTGLGTEYSIRQYQRDGRLVRITDTAAP